YKAEILEFINALLDDKAMPVTGADGMQSLKIGLAAYKSLQEGRPVKISEIG
ncbi:MAG: inositol 2-dehydrogenase, partial [Algicola sp.]|nr:inositol 2-dehydrogenase [Algicola sp.]